MLTCVLEVISKQQVSKSANRNKSKQPKAKSIKTRNMETLKEESNEETSSIDVVDGDEDLDPRIQVCSISPALSAKSVVIKTCQVETQNND